MQVELKRIQREVGITFVFVTHDQDEALTMSDRMAVMCEGTVHQCGTPEDIYERPATRFVAELHRHRQPHVRGVRRGGPHPARWRRAAGRPPGRRADRASDLSIAVRPEKIWLSDIKPDMVQTDGILKATVYGGATTTYLIEIAPGVEISALEQNIDSMRTDDRWADGERIRVGWRTDHILVLR